jgi:hypothetical protein
MASRCTSAPRTSCASLATCKSTALSSRSRVPGCSPRRRPLLSSTPCRTPSHERHCCANYASSSSVSRAATMTSSWSPTSRTCRACLGHMRVVGVPCWRWRQSCCGCPIHSSSIGRLTHPRSAGHQESERGVSERPVRLTQHQTRVLAFVIYASYRHIRQYRRKQKGKRNHELRLKPNAKTPSCSSPRLSTPTWPCATISCNSSCAPGHISMPHAWRASW